MFVNQAFKFKVSNENLPYLETFHLSVLCGTVIRDESMRSFTKWLISHTRKIVNSLYVSVTTSSGFYDLINAIPPHFNGNRMLHKGHKIRDKLYLPRRGSH